MRYLLLCSWAEILTQQSLVTVLGLWLDFLILKVSSNLDVSMFLWFQVRLLSLHHDSTPGIHFFILTDCLCCCCVLWFLLLEDRRPEPYEIFQIIFAKFVESQNILGQKTPLTLSLIINLTLPSPPLKYVLKCHIYTLFKYLQGW